MLTTVNVRNVLIACFVALLGASNPTRCLAQGPPPVSVSYVQTGPVGGYVTETMTASLNNSTATLQCVAYIVTQDPVTGNFTYTPYGTAVSLTPVYVNYRGVSWFNGTFTGSGTLLAGQGNCYFIQTQQLYNGAWWNVAASTLFTP